MDAGFLNNDGYFSSLWEAFLRNYGSIILMGEPNVTDKEIFSFHRGWFIEVYETLFRVSFNILWKFEKLYRNFISVDESRSLKYFTEFYVKSFIYF